MAAEQAFRYCIGCSASGCETPAVYKIAAVWSDGTSRELKNYGLACDEHRELLLAAARQRHQAPKRAEDETVGPVALYRLRSGYRDQELEPLP
jgi:hypothetical protein